MSKHRERTFEDEVVAHLTAHGWLEGTSVGYDRELAHYPEDVLGWLEETQPTELAKIGRLHNGDTGKVVLKRLAEVLDKDGSLAVLRRGFKHVSARLGMCQFKPAQGLNPTTLARYGKVRCRVVRQLRYSLNVSRLHRTAPGKDKTYVLDFVNDPDQILAAFKPYYKRAELAGVTDPNLIHNLQAQLDDERIYTESEIETFVKVYLDPKGKLAALQAALAPAVERFRARWREAKDAGDKKRLDELEIVRKNLASFGRQC